MRIHPHPCISERQQLSFSVLGPLTLAGGRPDKPAACSLKPGGRPDKPAARSVVRRDLPSLCSSVCASGLEGPLDSAAAAALGSLPRAADPAAAAGKPPWRCPPAAPQGPAGRCSGLRPRPEHCPPRSTTLLSVVSQTVLSAGGLRIRIWFGPVCSLGLSVESATGSPINHTTFQTPVGGQVANIHRACVYSCRPGSLPGERAGCRPGAGPPARGSGCPDPGELSGGWGEFEGFQESAARAQQFSLALELLARPTEPQPPRTSSSSHQLHRGGPWAAGSAARPSAEPILSYENVFRSAFQEVPVEQATEDISTLDHFLGKNSEENPDLTSVHKLCCDSRRLWRALQSSISMSASQCLWRGSRCQENLLLLLGIDAAQSLSGGQGPILDGSDVSEPEDRLAGSTFQPQPCKALIQTKLSGTAGRRRGSLITYSLFLKTPPSGTSSTPQCHRRFSLHAT
ncbi:PREDICTED: uncharacterized protein C14orf79 homolog [Dipodomys ordii]|uniref:Uncharacterized protein C14orf79 homolog n=1 Tax=Dipodomys ordii TaxID=10020 RepID=A0A1S3EWB5_DIPOR|nr:PREDICTED: uncharacterized protein C14orf79 homolog [Dipodomys ordii]